MTTATATEILLTVSDLDIAQHAQNIDNDFNLVENNAHVIVNYLTTKELDEGGLEDCIYQAACAKLEAANPLLVMDADWPTNLHLIGYTQPLRKHTTPGMIHSGLAMMQPPQYWTVAMTIDTDQPIPENVMLTNTPQINPEED
jgi:hypothetical protein